MTGTYVVVTPSLDVANLDADDILAGTAFPGPAFDDCGNPTPEASAAVDELLAEACDRFARLARVAGYVVFWASDDGGPDEHAVERRAERDGLVPAEFEAVSGMLGIVWDSLQDYFLDTHHHGSILTA